MVDVPKKPQQQQQQAPRQAVHNYRAFGTVQDLAAWLEENAEDAQEPSHELTLFDPRLESRGDDELQDMVTIGARLHLGRWGAVYTARFQDSQRANAQKQPIHDLVVKVYRKSSKKMPAALSKMNQAPEITSGVLDDEATDAWEEWARRVLMIRNEVDMLTKLRATLVTKQSHLMGGFLERHLMLKHLVLETLDAAFLVTPRGFMDVKTLKLHSEHPLDPPHNQRQVFMGAWSGLLEMHNHGFVHFDIKPDNIVLAENGAVKLIDFQHTAQLNGKKEHLAGRGTRGYVSPEAQRGQKVGTDADVYALLVTLYFLVTGREAFPERVNDIAALRVARAFKALLAVAFKPVQFRTLVTQLPTTLLVATQMQATLLTNTNHPDGGLVLTDTGYDEGARRVYGSGGDSALMKRRRRAEAQREVLLAENRRLKAQLARVKELVDDAQAVGNSAV